MKTLILLFTLAISASSFKYHKVTVNSARVTETASSFLYQFDLSKYIATIDSSIDSAKHIIVFAPGDTTIKYPRDVHYIPGKRALVYVSTSKSATVDKKMWIAYDTAFTGVNSTATFTNNNVAHYWGIDRFAGNTFYDYAGSNNGTGTSVDTVRATLGLGALFNANADRITVGSMLDTVSSYTISFVWIVTQMSTGVKYLYRDYLDGNNYVMVYVHTTNVLTLQEAIGGSASYARYDLDDGGTDVGDTILVTYAFNGSGAANSDRIKLYLNATPQTLTFTGTIAATTPNSPTTDITFGWVSATGLFGVLDEMCISTDTKSPGYIADQYKMLFDTTFYSVGAMRPDVLPPVITAQPVSDTVQTGTTASFSITATGDSLQYTWYKQGVATGTITPTYTFTPTTANDNDSIQCVVYNLGDTVTSSTARLRVFGIDSTGIAQFTLYHTGEVDSVHIDGVKATLSAAGTDSVRVAPATPLMVRSAAYTITLFDADVGYPYVYYMIGTQIDTILPRYPRRDSTITIVCNNLIDSVSNPFFKINSVTLPITRWSNDTIKASIPSWVPAGKYSYPWAGYVPDDTIAIDTFHTNIRVRLPQVISGGN